jgi:hypothetical protein
MKHGSATVCFPPRVEYAQGMDANQPHASRSSSNRRLLIADPNQQLINAVRAQVALPSPDSRGYWELRYVRTVEVEVQLTRVTHQASESATEQPIMWG